jgi:hypothetical protein
VRTATRWACSGSCPSRGSRLLSCLAWAGCLGACADPEPLSFELAFDPPTLGETAASIEARILRTACTGGELLYETTVHPGEPAEGNLPPVLDDGAYCFDAVATDGSCMRFAAGSEQVTLPREGSVVVVMRAQTPVAVCDATESCSGGECTGQTCSDDTADCDQIPDNGCETVTSSDPTNCGTCRRFCLPGTSCCDGRCCADCDEPFSCFFGFP